MDTNPPPSLPNELIDKILGYCDVPSYPPCALVNSVFVEVARNHLYSHIIIAMSDLEVVPNLETSSHLLSGTKSALISLSTDRIIYILKLAQELVKHNKLQSLDIQLFGDFLIPDDPSSHDPHHLYELMCLPSLSLSADIFSSHRKKTYLAPFYMSTLHAPSLQHLSWYCPNQMDAAVRQLQPPNRDKFPSIKSLNLYLASDSAGLQSYAPLPPFVNLDKMQDLFVNLYFESGELHIGFISPLVSSIFASVPKSLTHLTWQTYSIGRHNARCLEVLSDPCMKDFADFRSIKSVALSSSVSLKEDSDTLASLSNFISSLLTSLCPQAPLEHLHILVTLIEKVDDSKLQVLQNHPIWITIDQTKQSTFPTCSLHVYLGSAQDPLASIFGAQTVGHFYTRDGHGGKEERPAGWPFFHD